MSRGGGRGGRQRARRARRRVGALSGGRPAQRAEIEASICGRSLALLGVGGEDLNVYEGTLALLDRHRRAIPFAEMVSHRFDLADAPATMALALDADASPTVLITPGRDERAG